MKKNISFIALLLFCLAANAQTFQTDQYFEDSIFVIPDIDESMLTKQWQLVSTQNCDRCFDYVLTDSLFAIFKPDHTCYGTALVIKGTWQLNGTRLIVSFNDNSGKNQEFVSYVDITDSTLSLTREGYYGSTSKEFKVFNPK